MNGWDFNALSQTKTGELSHQNSRGFRKNHGILMYTNIITISRAWDSCPKYSGTCFTSPEKWY
jgi:hypothetical protein